MPVLNIGGQSVNVSDDFLRLSPNQQDATVDEIAQSIGVKGGKKSDIFADIAPATGARTAPRKGYFDDLVPEPGAKPAAKKGYFDDLVPEGYVLDKPSSALPDGYVLDQPAAGSGGFLANAADLVKSFPEGVARGLREFGRGHQTEAEFFNQPFTGGPVPTGPDLPTGLPLPEGKAGEIGVGLGEALGNPASWMGPGGPLLKGAGAVLGSLGARLGEETGLPGGRLVGGILGGTIGAKTMEPRAPKPTLAPRNVRNVAGVDVPLSPGQETGNVTQQIMENAALRGARGNPAQQVAERFFTGQQQPANEAARAAVGRGLDPFGQAVAESPQEAGELVGQSVRDIASTQKQGYKSLYDEAMGLPGEFHASAFEGIGQRIKGDLSLGKSPVIIDDVTTPVANRAIQDIDNNISKLKIQNRADPFGQPNPQNITGVNLAGVDQTRKRLTAMASATDPGSADRRAMSRIISSFDDHIEGAISDGLFTGDDRALDAIREARGAYSQYRKTFSSQGAGDDVGRVMEKIIGRNGGDGATPTEIANYLYGNAKVGGSGTSVRLAQRLQGVLGPQSPEWSAVRQGLWSRLTEATEGTAAFGPQRISNRVGEFLNGSGKPLAQMMFTAGERSQMQRYAELQQQLTPKPGTVNYSNTGVLMSALKASANSILTFLGAHLGGPVGAVAGASVGPIGSKIKEGLAAGALSRSLYQKPPRVGAPVRFGRGAVRNTVLSLSPAPQNQQ
jgi:hypothetical protein